MVAVEAALMVLGWMENLTPDEIPPERIWGHSERLELWFHQIGEKRKHPEKEIEAVPEPGMPVAGMSENALTKDLLSGR